MSAQPQAIVTLTSIYQSDTQTLERTEHHNGYILRVNSAVKNTYNLMREAVVIKLAMSNKY